MFELDSENNGQLNSEGFWLTIVPLLKYVWFLLSIANLLLQLLRQENEKIVLARSWIYGAH